MNARCKPGDLAIVIDAWHPCNIGAIVQVIRPDDGSGDIAYDGDAGLVWWCISSKPLKWTCRGKTYFRKQGPAPDIQLQPIRGLPDIAELVMLRYREDEKKDRLDPPRVVTTRTETFREPCLHESQFT